MAVAAKWQGWVKRIGGALALLPLASAIAAPAEPVQATKPTAASRIITLCYERTDVLPWRSQNGQGLNFDLLSDAKLLLTDELIALMLKERKEAGTLPPGAEAGAGIGDRRGAGAADDDQFDEIVTYSGDDDDADDDKE